MTTTRIEYEQWERGDEEIVNKTKKVIKIKHDLSKIKFLNL